MCNNNFVHADLHPGNIMIKFTKSNIYNTTSNLDGSQFMNGRDFENCHQTNSNHFLGYGIDEHEKSLKFFGFISVKRLVN